jgi:hypothetical protein
MSDSPGGVRGHGVQGDLATVLTRSSANRGACVTHETARTPPDLSTRGDRQLSAWAAQHAEYERVLGLPGEPRTVTPEVRSIAAAAERAEDAADEARGG